MKKHVIIGTFGQTDTVKLSNNSNEHETLFPLTIGNDNRLNFGIGLTLEELEKIKIFPTEMALDLLIVAAHVFAADTRVSRKTESQDSWTREIRLLVPVSNPNVWNNTKKLLSRLLNYLTGDRWEVDFRKRPSGFDKLVPDKPATLFGPPYNIVQLFSGGLDSLIGAIDSLNSGNIPILISHAGDGATSDAQQACYDALKEKYPKQTFDRVRLWMNISTELVTVSDIEPTTRGRSFLFFALGIFAGSGLASPFILQAPENGLIALNVPLDSLRLGSLSTHTTHPFYMNCWNELLKIIQIKGSVINPYWDQTKREMVDNCKDKKILQSIFPDSLSCSSPAKGRWKGHGIEHCGFCLPCLIRRASLLKVSGINDTTKYTLNKLTAKKLNSLQSEGKQIRSFQFAIARLKKTPTIASLLIHKSGPLPQDKVVLKKLEDVYIRGMLEVDNLIQKVKTEPQP